MGSITLENVRKSFGSADIIQGASLEIEDGWAGSARAWRTEEVTSYESGFKRELEAFHDWIVTGREPATAGRDGLRDIALCQAIIECHHRGVPLEDPSDER